MILKEGTAVQADRDLVEKLYQTVKIEAGPEDLTEMQEEIQQLTDWVAGVLAVETGEVEPTFYIFETSNVQRADDAIIRENRGKLFQATDNFEDGFYRVPPTIE